MPAGGYQRFHTVEKRIRQVLEWIETGREAAYHEDGDRDGGICCAAAAVPAGPGAAIDDPEIPGYGWK